VNFRRAIGQGLGVDRGDQTDSELISASLVEPEAFVGIFDRHVDAISRYVARRMGAELTGELTSEVFTTAFARRDRYDLAQQHAIPWLYGIASNLMRRHRRTERRRLRAYARGGVDRGVVLEDSPPSDPDVAAALMSLSTFDREVLLLFAWADLSYEQIASALSVPVGTVRSRLHRARRELRAALSGDPRPLETEVADG
jgi:RNA polymerase sigma-70 factor (ECF subfamily)